MIPELLFAALAVAAAVAAPRVLRQRDPLRRRRERALGMAGRLALPAPVCVGTMRLLGKEIAVYARPRTRSVPMPPPPDDRKD